MLNRSFGRGILLACVVALGVLGNYANADTNGLASANSVSLFARSPQDNSGGSNRNSGGGGSSDNSKSGSGSSDNKNGDSKGNSNDSDEPQFDDSPSTIKLLEPQSTYKEKLRFPLGSVITIKWSYDLDTLKIKPKKVFIDISKTRTDFVNIASNLSYANPTTFKWDTSKWDSVEKNFPLSAGEYHFYIYDENGRFNQTEAQGRMQTYSQLSLILYSRGEFCAECTVGDASRAPLPILAASVASLVMGAMAYFSL
ncbi:hypothetical protein THASP1DRAFT_28150 [Thamnocephalis sphaerospora]|uniref:DUF7137 domain-containing protein n=1 Tax=Thamnocephalis sphaerospora TaxID=78915 RepID=A0A4P9XV03_9FUNG|nr:hypothetical protein THASP1DRAFT_28150 [Thamnocephalis sphaerospora]|eukprot:RKP10068.1 hypothetical protein THASP1DRAFT_28150 [Thamnocephalis sphaerospora]